MKITISTKVNSDIKTVWDAWTNPLHITEWNFASPDWHCPKAMNDLREGGSFSYRMEAKNGRTAFDFDGTYDIIIEHELITFALNDGRLVEVLFTTDEATTTISESFEAENEHAAEQQKAGWQAILNNLKSMWKASNYLASPFLLIFLLVLPQAITAQSSASQKPQAYFSALIVGDIDSSIEWYSKVAGFKEINRNEVEEIGLIQVNLSNGNSLLELIELASAEQLNTLVSDFNPRTRIVGFFKIGYQVEDFDAWLDTIRSDGIGDDENIVLDPVTQKRMVILLDPDGNRIQFFEK